jgi:hypothetical protein
MTEFFDKLRSDRATERAIELASEIEERSVQARLQATLALRLADVDVSNAVLRAVLGVSIADLPDEPQRGKTVRSIRPSQRPVQSEGSESAPT